MQDADEDDATTPFVEDAEASGFCEDAVYDVLSFLLLLLLLLMLLMLLWDTGMGVRLEENARASQPGRASGGQARRRVQRGSRHTNQAKHQSTRQSRQGRTTIAHAEQRAMYRD